MFYIHSFKHILVYMPKNDQSEQRRMGKKRVLSHAQERKGCTVGTEEICSRLF